MSAWIGESYNYDSFGTVFDAQLDIFDGEYAANDDGELGVLLAKISPKS